MLIVATSYAGFADYSAFFTNSQVIWIVIGTGIFVGTALSVVPQIVVLIRRRTNFGLNASFVFLTNLGHFCVFTNITSLHATDFVAIVQRATFSSYPTFLTFLNIFCLWFFYHYVVHLNLMYFDIEQRSHRSVGQTRAMRFVTIGFTVGWGFLFLAMAAVLAALLASYGMRSIALESFGGVCGLAAVGISLAQYLPQMVTTIRLRDNGSLSILMLTLQFPGGLVNALFMWLGRHEAWSSWASTMAAAIQQMILLGICLFFKARKRYEQRRNLPLLGMDQTEIATSGTVSAFI
jgi:uncharacterized protein with PQ loop repeat